MDVVMTLRDRNQVYVHMRCGKYTVQQAHNIETTLFQHCVPAGVFISRGIDTHSYEVTLSKLLCLIAEMGPL